MVRQAHHERHHRCQSRQEEPSSSSVVAISVAVTVVVSPSLRQSRFWEKLRLYIVGVIVPLLVVAVVYLLRILTGNPRS